MKETGTTRRCLEEVHHTASPSYHPPLPPLQKMTVHPPPHLHHSPQASLHLMLTLLPLQLHLQLEQPQQQQLSPESHLRALCSLLPRSTQKQQQRQKRLLRRCGRRCRRRGRHVLRKKKQKKRKEATESRPPVQLSPEDPLAARPRDTLAAHHCCCCCCCVRIPLPCCSGAAAAARVEEATVGKERKKRLQTGCC